MAWYDMAWDAALHIGAGRAQWELEDAAFPMLAPKAVAGPALRASTSLSPSPDPANKRDEPSWRAPLDGIWLLMLLMLVLLLL
jgi:hypothetical protein